MEITNNIPGTGQTQNTGQPGASGQNGEEDNGQSSTVTGKASLGKNDFLQLLVAQMKNQDPINPMDGTQFASQLAQFNSVEQLINLNEGMNMMARSQQNMNTGLSNTMASTLAGKSIRALSDQVALSPTGDTDIQFELNNVATSAQLTIKDAAGNVVRSEELGNLGSGDHTWTWDGRSDAGSRVPEGNYSVNIEASNGDAEVDVLTFMEGIAEKVSYTGEGVRLLVNGVYLPLGDVETVGTSSGES
ncbi:MAG: flagellar hook capping FlgD N-terminal domain-containing protein [Balneolaceae bacterium]|nr:flagellar hook capping FlgD N-terminal domain-containing protein [Balneolaceae bacterium]